MNLRQLYYFKELAKIEHITQAAAKLSITQPSLSHAISELEKELGTYLFEKQGRNIRLTKYGEFYLQYVNRALDELEKGERHLRELTSPSHGRVDLAFIYTLGPHLVPSMIQAFSKEEANQHISFSLHQGITKNIIANLKEGLVDLAFCSHVENEDDIEFTPLMEQELVLIVPPHHPLANEERIDLAQTREYPFVFYSKGSGLRPTIDELFSRAGFEPTIACEVEEDNTMAGLVAVDFGIAIMPKISSLRHFDVKSLPIASPSHQRFIYLATVRNRYLAPAASKFKQFATEFVNKNA